MVRVNACSMHVMPVSFNHACYMCYMHGSDLWLRGVRMHNTCRMIHVKCMAYVNCMVCACTAHNTCMVYACTAHDKCMVCKHVYKLPVVQ